MARIPLILSGAAFLSYVGFALSHSIDVGITRAHVYRGVQDYYARHGRWPKTADEVITTMDAPYAIRTMDPSFRPLSPTEVEMEFTDWSYLIPLRDRSQIHAPTPSGIGLRG